MPKANGPKIPNIQKQFEKLDQFRNDIREATKSTPRFLFRIWTDESGGHRGLNTVRAITPLAFFNGAKGPSSFYDMAPREIQRIAFAHISGYSSEQTVFSSWSHSLAFVISWAESYHSQGEQPYISVLDIKKLSDTNVVIHTAPLDQIMRSTVGSGTGVWGYEFLAFGVITNDAYGSISFEDIQKARFPGLTSLQVPHAALPIGELFAGITDAQSRIYTVIRLASLFGKDYNIAVAASLIALAVKDESERNTMIQDFISTSALHISEDWKDDPLIFNQGTKHYGHLESEQAAQHLRELVLARYPPKAEPAKKVRSEKEDKEAAAEAEAAMEHVMNSDRVPEKVKGTYFQMVKVPRMVKELEWNLKK